MKKEVICITEITTLSDHFHVIIILSILYTFSNDAKVVDMILLSQVSEQRSHSYYFMGLSFQICVVLTDSYLRAAFQFISGASDQSWWQPSPFYSIWLSASNTSRVLLNLPSSKWFNFHIFIPIYIERERLRENIIINNYNIQGGNPREWIVIFLFQTPNRKGPVCFFGSSQKEYGFQISSPLKSSLTQCKIVISMFLLVTCFQTPSPRMQALGGSILELSPPPFLFHCCLRR